MSDTRAAPPASPAVVWHDAECGGYRADLPLWERLADRRGGPVLDLGAGTGRVALHLAARGFEVVAVDDDAELLDALERRATELGVPVETAAADVRELALGRRFGLILAPMQLIHLLGGVPGRARAWSVLTAHLAPSGLIAVAMLHEPLPPSGRAEPLPDVREVDGWVHSSLPLDVRVEEDSIELDRLRQVVSPEGRLSEDLDTTRLDRISIETLRLEVAAAGLEVTSTEPIPATAEHVASLLVLIEAADA